MLQYVYKYNTVNLPNKTQKVNKIKKHQNTNTILKTNTFYTHLTKILNYKQAKINIHN